MSTYPVINIPVSTPSPLTPYPLLVSASVNYPCHNFNPPPPPHIITSQLSTPFSLSPHKCHHFTHINYPLSSPYKRQLLINTVVSPPPPPPHHHIISQLLFLSTPLKYQLPPSVCTWQLLPVSYSCVCVCVCVCVCACVSWGRGWGLGELELLVGSNIRFIFLNYILLFLIWHMYLYIIHC